ncbi:MAG TPA: hypothetical protein VF590_11340 [Isosphaeraceae bacterium]|jgi:hypothetical protein
MRGLGAGVVGWILGGWALAGLADEPPLAEYFRAETARLAARPLDVRRALAALHTLPELGGKALDLSGCGQAATWALWAAVFEPEVHSVDLDDLPTTVREAPALLNLDRVLGMPQALALLFPRPVTLVRTDYAPWGWARDLAARLAPGEVWPVNGGGFR